MSNKHTVHPTDLVKGLHGWEMTTTVDMEQEITEGLDQGKRVLRIRTGKSSRGLTTHARCHIAKPDGTLTFVICQDYSRIIGNHGKRCTEANVMDSHMEAMKNIDQVLADAKAFYVKQANAA